MIHLAIPLVIGLLAAIAFFWNRIAHLFQTYIIPQTRKLFGESTAALLTDLIVFLDSGFCRAREVLVRAWHALKSLIGIKTRVRKVSATVVETVTEAEYRREDGRVVKQTVTEQVEWYDLPQDIREQMMRAQTTTAEFNGMDVVDQRMREQCKKHGIQELEMVA